MGKSEHTFSANDQICTPAMVYEPLIAALGSIGLDPFGNPASTVPAKTTIMLPQYRADAGLARTCVKCGDHWEVDHVRCPSCLTSTAPQARWHGLDDRGVIWGDAYDHDWCGHGLVFANGPYSDVALWAHKMWSETGGDEVVGLLPVRTGSVWWQTYIARSDAILFLKGRVHFDNFPHQAPFHSALSYVGPRGDLFVAGMQELGWCVRNRREWA